MHAAGAKLAAAATALSVTDMSMCPDHCTWLHLHSISSFFKPPQSLHIRKPATTPTTPPLIHPSNTPCCIYKAPLHHQPPENILPSSPAGASLSMSNGGSPTSSSPPSSSCSRSWSISEDSLRRYVSYASESCIQELLAASDSGQSGGGGGRNAGGDGEDGGGWTTLAYCNGVEISKRRSGPAHVFRSRWLLHAVSPEQFMAVTNAVDAAKQWESDLVDATYIKELGDDLSIIHLKFGDASKRPGGLFRRRDLVVYERRQTMDDGTLVVAVASLPKEIAAGLLPRDSKGRSAGSGSVGRGLVLQSGWVVEKLDGEPESCVVTYMVQLDPAAGWLPRCIVGRLNSKLVVIIAKLKKLAQTTTSATTWPAPPPASSSCSSDEVVI